MSTDHHRFEARCEECGHVGAQIEHSSDWDDWTTYEGFEELTPSDEAVARQRASAHDRLPVCKCGSTRILRGVHLSST